MTSQLASMSLGGAKGDVKYDRKGRLVNSAGVIGGPFSAGSYTATTATVAGFANATSFTASTSRYVQNGQNVTLYVKGDWKVADSQASASSTVSIPTNLLPRAGVSVTPVGVMTLQPSNATNAAVVSTTVGAFATATYGGSISLAAVTNASGAGATSTYSAVINYNI